MPLAPALKTLLLTTSLLAAGIAAYETDPNVRRFVDAGVQKAEDVVVGFLERLEEEFAPDGAALRIRRGRRDGRMGVGVGGGGEAGRGGRGGDVVVRVGEREVERGGDGVRRRHHRIEIVDADDEAATATATPRVDQERETLFEQFPSSISSSSATGSRTGLRRIEVESGGAPTAPDTRNNTSGLLIDADSDENIRLIDTEEAGEGDILSQTTTTMSSLDDLSDLDPLAHQHAYTTPLDLDIPQTTSPRSFATDEPQTPTTPTSPTGSPRILTPITPRTPRTLATNSEGESDVAESYFTDFSAREDVERSRDASRSRSRRVSVATTMTVSSGVGFATPDGSEDEDEEGLWGRA